MLGVLQTQIEAQGKRLTRARLLCHPEIADRIPVQVFDESFFTWHTLKPIFKCQLDTRNAVPVDIGQPQQLRGDLSCRVITSVLALSPYTRKVLSQYLPGKFRRLMPREIHKLLIAIKSQLVAECRRIEGEPCRKIVKARAVLQLLRVRPQ